MPVNLNATRGMVAGVLLISACLVGSHAGRANDAPTASTALQDAPGAFQCAFKSGTYGSLAEGVFQAKPTQPLSFSIDEVNLERQSASLKTTDSAIPGKLSIVRAINANHFIEVQNEGFLNLTTVYDQDPKTGLHPAIHSRHMGFLGQPVFGQYTGFCTPKT